MSSLLIKNCRLPDETVPMDILCQDGLISEIREHMQSSGPTIDAQFNIVAPGLLDIHVHGAGGIDFLNMDIKSYETAAQTMARQGTTGFLATILIDARNLQVLTGLADLVKQKVQGARLLGIHAEGPFINKDKRGGFPLECIHPADTRLLSDLLGYANHAVSMMTLAPEIIDQTILDMLIENHITPAIGHTDISYDGMKTALSKNLNHLTHVFNAMNGIHHREPGPILAAWEDPASTIQIIADGHHLSPVIVRMLYHLWGPARCIIITDGLNSQGLPDGEYEYIGQSYVVQNKLARYHDGTIIGTTLGMLDMVKNFKAFTGCTLAEAIDAASLNPARLLGWDQKGKIDLGKHADLVIFNQSFELKSTIISGHVVHCTL